MDRMTDQPDLNTGKEWSKNDLFSLRNRIEHGRTVGHVATFLMRTKQRSARRHPSLGPSFPRQRLANSRDLESYVRYGSLADITARSCPLYPR